ncbi:P-loop containing nucleoside triphosphate hydrolase protein [Tothia fuscella]|uniref:P-loop containing nucleoside triphosphate hydrolase protein n=1 Tax=Tothia fuscella TaxID=1048955 RepID=A0A9P4P5H7_9PEZI|nr:P-loop containing nucleoside triphosphate hydrolase protein [Tothia fuscella]
MDIKKLRLVLNSTGEAGNLSQLNLAPNLLETFIPGYGLISKFILDTFGFDIGVVVSAGLLIFATGTAWKYVSKLAWTFLNQYLVASVYFDDHDDLFPSVLAWIADQRVGRVARRLKAVSKQGSSPEEDDVGEMDNDPAELFHFGRWAAKVPPKYEPYFGSYQFTFGYRFFIFERGKREKSSSPWQPRSEEEHIVLKTFGWSTAPIKALLVHIKQWSIERENSITVIKRPQSKEIRRYQGAWSRVTSRPSRPMETVVLDPEQKEALIADVNEYLSPASPRWYAVRGIPYRRGYLFYGPPGTGKSSLSFALAGLFGLNIFVISLLEPTLTESDLMQLFNNLPRRCIVLLEDIDTAGLAREEEKLDDTTKDKKEEKDEKFSAADLAKELRKTAGGGRRGGGGGGGSDDLKPGISLSGLLNAIDGVASHEGRVLVMTTNHPEKLDSALIRPGRVDMQVAFTLATKHQTREIFSRMYSTDHDTGPKKSVIGITVTSNGHSPNGTAGKLLTNNHKIGEAYTRDEIEELADKFADLVPEGKFSPAEVQNFLITRKKDPQRAMDDVALWRDQLLEAKERKSKIVFVQ